MKKALRGGFRLFQDMDKGLLIVTIILFLFGLLNIVTASSSEATANNTSLYYFFYQQLKMIGIGVILGIIILNIDTKKYPPFAIIGFIAITAILLYLSMYGSDYRGSRNWVAFGPIRFQPSEFAKPIVIVCLSLMFEKYASRLRNRKMPHTEMIVKIIVVGLSIPIIIFLQKDFGTMFILLCTFLVMFIASPILRIDKVRAFGVMALVAGLGMIGMYMGKGYILSEEQLDRFDFFNPCTKYETGGYQICNGYIAINDGGLFGVGPGKSKQKYSYIPEPHTDSVFAIIAEEYGFLKSTLIFVLYIYILKRIINLACVANTLRGRFMCLGIATYIFMHILVNLGGLFGVMPLTGVPLPFLSYGGSFAISLIISLAIVQRVHIETRRQKIKLR